MAIPWGIVEALMDIVAPQLLNRRRVRFTVHRAAFVGTGRQAFFFNMTNLSKDREIEITHVWLACSPPIAVVQPQRPLPKRLKPDETWETWIYADDAPVPVHDAVVDLARAKLSTGKEVKAKFNSTVPPAGTVPVP